MIIIFIFSYMKKKSIIIIQALLLFFGLAVVTTGKAQVNFDPTKEIVLAVRADDIGFTHGGNLGIIQSCTQGIARTAEILATTPWFPEAVQLLQKNSTIDVGVHLCLSSEWTLLKWRPLTYAPSVCDSNGYFFSTTFTNPQQPFSLQAAQYRLIEIEKELRAQIELVKKNIPRVSHLTAHMGCWHVASDLTALVLKLSKEYKLPITTSNSKEYPHEMHNCVDLNNLGFEDKFLNTQGKLAKLKEILNNLKPGKINYLMTHPALQTPETDALQMHKYLRLHTPKYWI
jgi:chitin disaccharide deacetylase